MFTSQTGVKTCKADPLSLTRSDRPFQPSRRLADAWRSNRPLAVGIVSVAAAFLFALVALVVSPAQMLNEPAWLKPAKFGISIALYCFTFIWLLSPSATRPGR